MMTREITAETIKKITIRVIPEIIKRMIIKRTTTTTMTTTTTTMITNTELNTLMIMASMETNIHHMKKNKY